MPVVDLVRRPRRSSIDSIDVASAGALSRHAGWSLAIMAGIAVVSKCVGGAGTPLTCNREGRTSCRHSGCAASAVVSVILFCIANMVCIAVLRSPALIGGIVVSSCSTFIDARRLRPPELVARAPPHKHDGNDDDDDVDDDEDGDDDDDDGEDDDDDHDETQDEDQDEGEDEDEDKDKDDDDDQIEQAKLALDGRLPKKLRTDVKELAPASSSSSSGSEGAQVQEIEDSVRHSHPR